MSDDPSHRLQTPSAPEISPSAGLPVFRELSPRQVDHANIELTVFVELGRVRMKLTDILQLNEGSVVLLDRSASDPVDIVVNDELVARGEVVIVDGKFAVRINEVMPAGQ